MDPLFVDIEKDLQAEGLTVEAVAGWKTRGRPGTFTPKGKMNHHTASNPAGGDTPALGIVTHGRSDLPGPLSNFLIGRSGKVVIVAAGRCNHAGTGGPFRFLGKDAGNRDAVSVEIENNGVGEPYPAKQMQAIEKLNVVVLRRLGKTQWYAVGHKEYTSRKIDPSFSMDALRKRVKGLLSGSGKDWFDMATKKELEEVVEGVMLKHRKILTVGDPKKVGIGQRHNNLENLRKILNEIKAAVTK